MATVPYIDVATATSECFAERLFTSAWDNADPADQLKALQMATLVIDTLNFIGSKAGGEDQVREFPRDDDTEIPLEVQQATCECALALLQGRSLEKLAENSGILAESTGDASVSYDERGLEKILDDNLGLPSPMAARLIREWVVDADVITIDRV